MEQTESVEAPRLYSVPDAAKRWFDGREGTVRQLIFQADSEDPSDEAREFAACVVRVGRRVFVREDRMAAFIESRTGASAYRWPWQHDARQKAAAYEKAARTRAKKKKAAAAGAAS